MPMKSKGSFAGQLRHRVTLQQKQRVLNAKGVAESTWETVAKIWANVETLSEDETVQARAMYGSATHRILIRYRKGVTNQWRIQWEDEGATRTLSIRGAVDRENLKKWIWIIADEETTREA